MAATAAFSIAALPCEGRTGGRGPFAPLLAGGFLGEPDGDAPGVDVVALMGEPNMECMPTTASPSSSAAAGSETAAKTGATCCHSSWASVAHFGGADSWSLAAPGITQVSMSGRDGRT